jgi:hypothetical protein
MGDPLRQRGLPCGARAVMGGVSAGLVVSLLLPAVALAQAGGTPWTVPRGSRALQGPYLELYLKAQGSLDRWEKRGERPAAGDLDEVILQLTSAIATDPVSDIKPGTGGQRIPYFPYYELARAYLLKGLPDAAKGCVEEEERRGAMTRLDRYRPQIEALRGTIDAGYALQFARSLLEEVEGSGVARLDPQSPDPAAIRGRLDGGDASAAVGAIRDLLTRELRWRQGKLQELADAAWEAAFAASGGRPDPGRCAPPGAGDEALRGAVGTLQECDQALEAALRNAGKGACTAMTTRYRDLEDSLGTLRRLTAGSAAPAVQVPPACRGAAWDGLDRSRLQAELDGLDFAGTYDGIDAAARAARTQVQESWAEYQRGLAAVSARLLDFPDGCARALGLTAIQEEYADLRRRIRQHTTMTSPGPDFTPLAVDQALEALRQKIAAPRGAALASLLEPACNEVEPGAVNALAPATYDAFKSQASQDSLARLCQEATRVRRESDACWGRNRGKVRDRLQAYDWIVRRVPASDLACVSGAAGAMSRLLSQQRDSQAWIDSANEAIDDARNCLEAYQGAAADQREAVRAGLEDAAACLEQVPAERLGDLEAVASQLRQAGEDLERLGPVIALDEDLTEQSLRAALQAADLAPAAGEWDGLDRLEVLGDADRRNGLRVLQERAVHDGLARAEAALAVWAPRAGRIGPRLSLEAAFERFGAGDLDGAIGALRGESLRCGDAAGDGRGAALRHAALSYFLYLKAALYGGDGSSRVAEMLLEDAREQARAALASDGRFRLPEALFHNAGFREFFQGESRT